MVNIADVVNELLLNLDKIKFIIKIYCIMTELGSELNNAVVFNLSTSISQHFQEHQHRQMSLEHQ